MKSVRGRLRPLVEDVVSVLRSSSSSSALTAATVSGGRQTRGGGHRGGALVAAGTAAAAFWYFVKNDENSAVNGSWLGRQFFSPFFARAQCAASDVQSAVDVGSAKLSNRERRFMNFASIQFNDEIYMTPRDFLDSLTEQQPRRRIRRKVLTEGEVKKLLYKTPKFRSNSDHFFRDLDSQGLISYTEYVFILSVLTKPRHGFNIAFNMFDMDGNQRVDKHEFLVIQRLVSLLRSNGKIANLPKNEEAISDDDDSRTVRSLAHDAVEDGRADSTATSQLEELMSRSRISKQQQLRSSTVVDKAKTDEDKGVDADKGVDLWTRSSTAADDDTIAKDTTLLYHFFGQSGDRTLSYDDFQRFSDNLQSEILEIEFYEFSRGKPTISETDFAKLLLRYTLVHTTDYAEYIQRVEERIPNQTGITLAQFKEFCKFLNSFDDFTIAVKLYTFAGHSVSQEEFARAVKVSTGHQLDAHVVETVFQIFDANNDGRLSYAEFIAVMKDRIHRGFQSRMGKHGGSKWSNFKVCVRDELRKY